MDPLHRAKSGLCIKPGVCVEGSRRPFTLVVALSQLKRDFLTGLTPWIPTRTYTQNIHTSNYLGGGMVLYSTGSYLCAGRPPWISVREWQRARHGQKRGLARSESRFATRPLVSAATKGKSVSTLQPNKHFQANPSRFGVGARGKGPPRIPQPPPWNHGSRSLDLQNLQNLSCNSMCALETLPASRSSRMWE